MDLWRCAVHQQHLTTALVQTGAVQLNSSTTSFLCVHTPHGCTFVSFVATGYVAYSSFAEKVGLGGKSKKKSSTTVKGAPVALDHDDWVKGTQYDINKRKRAAAGNSKKTLAAEKADE